MKAERELWLQVTAGQGPAECAWAVVKVVDRLCAEAAAAGFAAQTLEVNPGPRPGTAESALVAVSAEAGADLESFIRSWHGTVQWIARSPYRPAHKRRNWFVGVAAVEPVDETHFDPKEVAWETMRAGGPGGQHVNRTESAVRATHLPTGLQATASEERSQHRNRKLALARLALKLAESDQKRQDQARAQRWQAHQDLERGNPVRVFREA